MKLSCSFGVIWTESMIGIYYLQVFYEIMNIETDYEIGCGKVIISKVEKNHSKWLQIYEYLNFMGFTILYEHLS
jgi:hypothetical protein